MRGLLWFLIGCSIGGLGVVAADAYAVDPFPVPKHVGGTFDRVVWQGPDGFARQIGNTSRLYYEPFSGGGATARSTTTAVTVAGDLDLHRTRNMTAQALARAGRIASRASGPLLILSAGLELADIVWGDDGPMVQGAPDPDEVWGYKSGIPYYRNTIYSDNVCVCGETGIPSCGGGRGNVSTGPARGCAICTDLGLRNWLIPISCVSPDPYFRPATDQDIEDAIYVELVAGGMGSELARRLIDAGYVPDMSPLEVSGPSSLDGPTTTSTSTGPAGTTTSSSSTRYDLGYSGNTVSVTPTTTTTTTTPDGQTTTETTTTAPGGGGTTVEVPDQPALCEEYPDISACQELGQPEDDQELPEEERDLDWEKEMSAAGSCPAPIPLTIRGSTYMFSYEPACIGANYLRPIIIGLAWLTAGIFLFSTVRQS